MCAYVRERAVQLVCSTVRSESDAEQRPLPLSSQLGTLKYAMEGPANGTHAAGAGIDEKGESLLRRAETILRQRTDRLVLVLERVLDTTNWVGCLRTAEILGRCGGRGGPNCRRAARLRVLTPRFVMSSLQAFRMCGLSSCREGMRKRSLRRRSSVSGQRKVVSARSSRRRRRLPRAQAQPGAHRQTQKQPQTAPRLPLRSTGEQGSGDTSQTQRVEHRRKMKVRESRFSPPAPSLYPAHAR